MSQNAKDRVFAAAEEIVAERRPTVSSVREAAGVSNSDATRFLRQWWAEREAVSSQVAATPPQVVEQATRLAGAIWTEAVRQSESRHSAVEAAWSQESSNKAAELAELVEDLDKAAGRFDAMSMTLNAEKTALEGKLMAREQELAEMQSSRDTLRVELEELRRELAGASAHASSQQTRIKALETDLAGVRDDLSQSQERAVRAETQAATLGATLESLQRQLDDRQARLDMAETAQAESQLAASAASARAATLQEANAALMARLTQPKTKNKGATAADSSPGDE
ncbi:DNA-binding protein [Arthrobacter sp. A2-55]|uniref:DNA-binding protein n=1 Tax=Arthrobacter sp. A2-55 TaxID=2897337 RepID=UPI0021CDB2F1|nr:DNA-binding protein [Arthrobacter sp. A2-55]MCU6480140.1 DNA-binding protein [Arthrobacter sp. A2-55]